MSYYPVSQESWSGGGGPMSRSSSSRKRKAGSASSSAKRASARPQAKLVKWTPLLAKRQIAKVVEGMMEKKYINRDPQTYSFNANNTTMSNPVDLISGLENINQGVGQGDRIGNEIKLTQATLRAVFTMNPSYISGQTFRPGYVQVWLGTLKDAPSTSPTAADLLRIYQDGSGSAGADGTVIATLRPLNRDHFNIRYYKKFKLGGAGAIYANNDFPIQQEIVVPNIVKGKVKYSDTSLPTNKYMYMWCTFTTVDSVPLTVTVPVDCSYFVDFRFVDA
jgi:hypothetical protein